mgnify:CR=1 FL=1|tara:strand:- start:1224 stop:2354 length:1131 start_codon:yes stop_codon:yes gene_type:complete
MESVKLLIVSYQASLRKFRYDLAREIVVGICTAVLLGLFFYIFRDFFKDKLSLISAPASVFMTQSFGLAILAFSALIGARISKREFTDPSSIGHMALLLGEKPSTIRSYKSMRIISNLTLTFIIPWALIYKWLQPWYFNTTILIQGGMFIVWTISWLMNSGYSENTKTYKPLLSQVSDKSSRIKTLILWRLRQILIRNKLTRAILLLAVLCLIIQWYLFSTEYSEVLSFIICLACSLLLASTIAIQMEEDMKHAWAEKCMGVSHQEIILALFAIGIIFGALFGLGTAAGGYMNQTDPQTQKGLILRLSMITALSPSIIPSIIFQIDPNRPMIQIINIIIVSLFLSTAIYAHWAFVALAPILAWYANQYQQNRFYRA